MNANQTTGLIIILSGFATCMIGIFTTDITFYGVKGGAFYLLLIFVLTIIGTWIFQQKENYND